MKRGTLIYIVETGERYLTRSNEKDGKIIVKNRKGSYKVVKVADIKEVETIGETV
jgi:replicative DNA helicase